MRFHTRWRTIPALSSTKLSLPYTNLYYLLHLTVHKPFAFSTSPFTAYTHWKQTVFYLQEPLTICSGEEINGAITCKPNHKNPRDLDISISVNFNGRCMQQQSTQEYRLR